MRKQTKLVAVASAAALLAIGASMTSFAATGWVEENGEWFYYEKDGSKAEDTWKKSGDKWFWLDSESDGAMALDKLIEDDDNTYYVDANGAMVSNTWVKVVNEDQDDDDDPAEYNYYYMQSNGKAYENSGDNTKFKTIDGKRYAFDEDGKMLYGWVGNGAERLDSEDGWTEADDVYYLGNWDDGAMKTGWQRINVSDNLDDDENKDFWFYFKSNGKKEYNKADSKDEIKEKTINGKKYGFDDRGVMVYEWTVATTTGNVNSASGWKYFNSPEDGARATKGWFKVVAPDDDNDNTFKDYDESYGSFAKTDADDENERWYYADGDGEIYAGIIKKIKGKYYAFRPDDGKKGGAMLSGLVLLRTDGKGNITNVYDDGVDSDELDDIIDGKDYSDDFDVDVYDDPNVSLYYFGNDEDSDGAMKTGATTVTVDGDSFNFLFDKSGGAEGKGKGVSGIDDGKYIYKFGLRIKADSDDKLRVVKVVGATIEETDKDGKKTTKIGGTDIASDGVKVTKIDSAELRDNAEELGTNKDGESVRGLVNTGANSDNKVVVSTTWDESYYLVNTSGAISKKKSGAKDGDDWYFYTNTNKRIVMYLNNKTYKEDTKEGYNMKADLDNWDSAAKGTFDPMK